MKRFRIALIWKVIIACVLGCGLGRLLPASVIRVFTTFNYLFSQYIGFMVPLIIVGLVTPAICKMGSKAGKILVFTMLLAYLSSITAGFFSYGISVNLFPKLPGSLHMEIGETIAKDTMPYFTLDIPAMLSVTTALTLSFVVGILLTTTGKGYLKNVVLDFEELIMKAISKTLIPLLPIYIFGIFLEMSHSGEMLPVISVFAIIFVTILTMSILWLLILFCISGAIAHRNPLKSLVAMLPAYLTALSTSSSAAAIPVTMSCAQKCGVSEPVRNFTIPLCATVHLPGSMLKITACAITIMMLHGTTVTAPLIINFIMMLAIIAIAAPGVPGGMIMASLGVLNSILGFDDSSQAMMITLYIVMDSFGTACNVTSDGAIALIVDKFFRQSQNQPTN